MDVEEQIPERSELLEMDDQLAAFEFGKLAAWQALTKGIDGRVLDRVIGQDTRGDYRVDALMECASNDTIRTGVSRLGGTKVWGKPRSEIDGGAVEEMGEIVDEENYLRFPVYDVRRSWPAGAVGSDLSRWSLDKSWLVGRIIREDLGGGEFILYPPLHSISSSVRDADVLAEQMLANWVPRYH